MILGIALVKILHLRHTDIDKQRWDATIAEAVNSMPYAFSWYLDAVSPGWEALATPDYGYVMPLPVKVKYGIRYLINPRWVQQLGVFSSTPPSAHIISLFVRRIPYLAYDFNINYSNLATLRNTAIRLPSTLRSAVASVRNNYVIDVTGGMQVVRSRYDANTRRSMARAHDCHLEIDDIDRDEFITLWCAENQDNPPEQHLRLPALVSAAERHGSAILQGVWREGVLIAAVFAIRTKDRVVFLAPVSTSEGKRCCAMFLMVDHLLKEWCCRYNLLFDCEGSMLPGVARFYRGFSPLNHPYTHISRLRPTHLIALLHRKR